MAEVLARNEPPQAVFDRARAARDLGRLTMFIDTGVLNRLLDGWDAANGTWESLTGGGHHPATCECLGCQVIRALHGGVHG